MLTDLVNSLNAILFVTPPIYYHSVRNNGGFLPLYAIFVLGLDSTCLEDTKEMPLPQQASLWALVSVLLNIQICLNLRRIFLQRLHHISRYL